MKNNSNKKKYLIFLMQVHKYINDRPANLPNLKNLQENQNQ